jgi:modulator of FtsH protease HflK
VQTAKGYKAKAVAEATGQAARFVSIYKEYKKAPDVTRKRMYLETMERIMRDSDKIIVDDKSISKVVPYLRLDWPEQRKNPVDDRA